MVPTQAIVDADVFRDVAAVRRERRTWTGPRGRKGTVRTHPAHPARVPLLLRRSLFRRHGQPDEQAPDAPGNDNPFWPHLDPLNWPHPRDVVSWSVHLPSRRW